MICITLPLPPSVNGLHWNVPGRGRVTSQRYRDWQTRAGWIVKAAKPEPVSGAYKFALFVSPSARADVDNYLKAAVDLFVKLKLTPDDKSMKSVSAERRDDVPSRSCIVQIEAAQ